MNVLVTCEESQAVCKAFRAKGHNAFSNDLQECSGGHPEWHIIGDALTVINGGTFVTQSGDVVTIEKWDMMIAHPPCTDLAISGSRWFPEKIKSGAQQRAIDFFMALASSSIEKTVIENPVCIMSTVYRKPDQIINPWQFGHPEQKKTCLWLKGLPPLMQTNNVFNFMHTLPLKERTRIHWLGGGKGKERSVTYPGIAQAMSEQWGGEILAPVQLDLF